MTPDEIMEAFSKWLREQMEHDHGPKAKWRKSTRDSFYTKIGEMVHFTGDLKRSKDITPPSTHES